MLGIFEKNLSNQTSYELCQLCLALLPTLYIGFTEQEAYPLPTRFIHITTNLSEITPLPLQATLWIGQLP